VIGPPAEVEELAGDRKTAIRWLDPPDVEVSQYQIRIDGGEWATYEMSDLSFDAAVGKWYLLFRDLVNEQTYHFEIRAVNAFGLTGDVYAIDSTPVSIGDIGGDDADLISIHGVYVVPEGGWIVGASGVGLSTVRPYEITMELDTTLNHSSLIKDRILLGEDATVVMYNHYDWRDEVSYVDRLDNELNWNEETHIYLEVTSGNREQIRYYDVAIRIPG
ncbi:MAG: hypothetical protein FWH55_14515, partial [Oscillospiraceae bacterium]|nr:hypothetical protein [Oscillospiraceae bacterium]